MKKTVLIALVSSTIFSGMNGATKTSIKNSSNNAVEVTLEDTVTQNKKNFTVNSNDTINLDSDNNSTVTLKTTQGSTTYGNLQVPLIEVTADGSISMKR